MPWKVQLIDWDRRIVREIPLAVAREWIAVRQRLDNGELKESYRGAILYQRDGNHWRIRTSRWVDDR